MYVRIRSGKEPLHPIGSHTLMTIAEAPAAYGQILRRLPAINNQEVVAAGAGFYKWHDGSGRIHSALRSPHDNSTRKNRRLFESTEHLLLLLTSAFNVKLKSNVLPGGSNLDILCDRVNTFQNAVDLHADFL